mgnify:CR=1 FL=1
MLHGKLKYAVKIAELAIFYSLVQAKGWSKNKNLKSMHPRDFDQAWN